MTTLPHLEISIKDFAYDEASTLHYGPLQTPPVTPDLNAYSSKTPSNRYSIIPAPIVDCREPDGEDDNDEYDDEYEYGYGEEEEEEGQYYEETELNSKAIALFPFTPENENEIELIEGEMIWINYRYGQGWLVASDLKTGEMGLIPEEYVRLIYDDDEEQQQQQKEEDPKRLEIVGFSNHDHNHEDDQDWVTEAEDEGEVEQGIKNLKVQSSK